MFLMMPSTKIAQMVLLHPNKTAAKIDKKYLQRTPPPEPLVQNIKYFRRDVPHDALYYYCSDHSVRLNKMTTSAKIELSLNDNISLTKGQNISCTRILVSNPGPSLKQANLTMN